MYEIRTRVKKYVDLAAKKHRVKPADVTVAQFWNIVSKDTGAQLTEWQVRKNGGFTNLKKLIYGSEVSAPATVTKVKWKPRLPKLTNFNVHRVDTSSLFKKLKLKKDDVLRVVVQPDTHVPDHDPDAISVFCKFLDHYKPHGLINLGDFLEMESVSHWRPNNPEPKRLVPELKVARKVLTQINDAAGEQCQFKVFLEGNHEFWLQSYLNERIPEVLDGLDELGVSLDIHDLIGLDDYGYDFIPVNEILALGEAHFIHGYYTGKHHASKHLDVFGVNLYYGHLHDVQGHSGVSVKGLHEAMSLGCLRTLNADFLRGKPHNWCHAFGIFEFRFDGSYTRYAPIIIDGEFSFNGKTFKG